MSESPESRPERRRRIGPLGDDEGYTEETRQSRPPDDPGATRQMRPEEWERTHREPVTSGGETRLMRPSLGDTREVPTYQPARSPYPEPVEERQEHLRELYGGVDWLASFLGFVFCVVAAAVLSSIAGLVLGPLGFSLNFGGRLGSAAITGLVVVAILIFLTYFFGGYVAGRLARFDGGINGVVTFLWSVVVAFIVAAAGPFLPSSGGAALRGFVEGRVLPGFNALLGMGGTGIGIIAGAVVIALLGGFLGGRAGSRYHTEIDRTT